MARRYLTKLEDVSRPVSKGGKNTEFDVVLTDAIIEVTKYKNMASYARKLETRVEIASGMGKPLYLFVEGLPASELKHLERLVDTGHFHVATTWGELDALVRATVVSP